jgi:SAM-dependent methyltransferase
MSAVREGSCYLCGSTSWRLVEEQADLRYYPQDRFQIVRCSKCGLLFTLPQLSEVEFAKYYPESYGAYQDNVEQLVASCSPGALPLAGSEAAYCRRLHEEVHAGGWKRARARARNSMTRLGYVVKGIQRASDLPYLLPVRDVSRPGAYLHIGSGTAGLFVRRLNEGWHVSAVDINRDLMARWCLHSSVNAVGGRIGDADFAEETFDVIFMSHVIEHLNDPLRELRRLCLWLKTGGTFVCELPVYGTLGWNFSRNFTFYDVPRHTMHLTRRTVRALLKASGFGGALIRSMPYCYGFYFSDYKRHYLTGKPPDVVDASGAYSSVLWRHKALGYASWMLGSSGNVWLYAVKGSPNGPGQEG